LGRDDESCELSGKHVTIKTIDLQIPEEIWRGESVDYSTLQIFGGLAYNLVDSQKGTN